MMHATTVVGYTANASEICTYCIDKYVEQCIDQRIDRLDALAPKYTWMSKDYDREEIQADLMEQEILPIFADSEHDSYPVCDVCGEKIEDITLTSDGVAYERRLEHEHLEREEDEYELTPEQQQYAAMQGARMEQRGLKFGIIYSVDLQHTEANWLDCYQPWPNQYPQPRQKVEGIMRGVWTKTEGDSEYEYDYLEGDWIGGIHRKYVACLNKKQFRKFMDHTSLRFETENTMGSRGGPTPDEPSGSISHMPAISFRDDDGENGVIISAYITPFWVGNHTPDDRDWDRIVEMLRSKYS